MAMIIKLVCVMMMMMMACSSASQVKTVSLNNDYGQTVNAYCQSKHDKIRGNTIDPGSALSWSFKENPFKSTLFWCDIDVDGKHLHFDIYKCTNGMYPTEWRIDNDGVHSTTVPRLSFSWNQL